MKHPKSEKVREVGNVFLGIFNTIKDCPIDMMATRVESNELNVCGTPHCHAGWYVAGSRVDYDGDQDYEGGSLKIATDLGFEDEHKLMNWADKNPEIWGNKDGGEMFSGSGAFGPEFEDDEKLTLEIIGNYWIDVANALEFLEGIDGES